jgi:outer membrane protein OmpA-like peptidoglycan-associated protein
MVFSRRFNQRCAALLSRATVPAVATVMVALVAPALAGCGPTVFEGQSGLGIVGSPPAPPPPPPPPPEPPKRVEVTKDKIQINEKVQFEYDKSTILQESFSLLDEVSKVMNENPQLKKIRVEGHASADGADDYNMRLSDARAKAVMTYLVTKGKVDQKRLTAEGFGETKPIADNETEDGRIANRRVEFTILEQDEKPAAATN